MARAAKIIDMSAHRRAAVPADWSRLGMLNSSLCPRDAVAMYARLGLHPILVHGVAENGTCTCGRSSCDTIGKHPVMRGWQSSALNTADIDETLTERWNLNIGLRMGP